MIFSLLDFLTFIFSILFTSSLIYNLTYNKLSNSYGEVLYEFPVRKLRVIIFIILFSIVSFIFIYDIVPKCSLLTKSLLFWFVIISFILCLDKSTEHLVITTNGIGYKNLLTNIQRDDFIEWTSIEQWNFEENEKDVLHLKLPDDYINNDKYLFIPTANQNIITSLFDMFCH